MTKDRKWPKEGPEDSKKIAHDTLFWDPQVDSIKIAKRCGVCKKLYLVPWDRLNSNRKVHCTKCKKKGLQDGSPAL